MTGLINVTLDYIIKHLHNTYGDINQVDINTNKENMMTYNSEHTIETLVEQLKNTYSLLLLNTNQL